MNYHETISWMFGRLPMYQQQGKTAFKDKLNGILSFSDHLKHPEKTFKSIHVAGTNGKGSTSHMISSILQEAGYKVGLYTSPHLKDFRERIKINGKEVSENFVTQFIAENKLFLEEHDLSFFEMTVGMAFDYFSREEIDIAVIEVGLGGRLDSTNIINPEISVITNIGLDHTDMLGDTLEKIAGEKAGIIKPFVPVVVGEYNEETFPVFEQIAKDKAASLILAEELVEESYKLDLKGNYQSKNSKTAVAAIRKLPGFNISEFYINNGLQNVIKNTGLKGRWQLLQESPKIICDTAHNKEGLELIAEQLNKEVFDNLHIVLGVVKDKNLEKILPLFPKDAKYYFCTPNINRAKAAKELMEKAAEYDLRGDVFNTVTEAYMDAKDKAKKEDLIYIGGSTFVVAEIL
ncbi:bifunctional folylpolyglutamate synthase/dihydrofolate synthase [Flavobacteriaceae bacterium R38]|nr:bifunctional folylpolyglutamate synthase/dihydrofolate synthase [Flavobacteriaceae bacterium R38]